MTKSDQPLEGSTKPLCTADGSIRAENGKHVAAAAFTALDMMLASSVHSEERTQMGVSETVVVPTNSSTLSLSYGRKDLDTETVLAGNESEQGDLLTRRAENADCGVTVEREVELSADQLELGSAILSWRSASRYAKATNNVFEAEFDRLVESVSPTPASKEYRSRVYLFVEVRPSPNTTDRSKN